MIATVCLQCGTPSRIERPTFCGRCGLRYGEPPRAEGRLAECHICYRTTDDDGRLESLEYRGLRVDIQRHLAEHDRHPVGDDEYLDTLRVGDRIRIDRWTAPFDLVRRYLVTGLIEAGRRRTFEHNAIVTAMSQIRRFGAGAEIFGDQPEWQASRAAVSHLMERYHQVRK